MSRNCCPARGKRPSACTRRCKPAAARSGSGVAVKVAGALCKRMCASDKVNARCREALLDAVGLAALGTVADVVPLRDENRILVRHGLARLRDRPGEGLKAILQS